MRRLFPVTEWKKKKNNRKSTGKVKTEECERLWKTRDTKVDAEDEHWAVLYEFLDKRDDRVCQNDKSSPKYSIIFEKMATSQVPRICIVVLMVILKILIEVNTTQKKNRRRFFFFFFETWNANAIYHSIFYGFLFSSLMSYIFLCGLSAAKVSLSQLKGSKTTQMFNVPTQPSSLLAFNGIVGCSCRTHFRCDNT